jgi:hypothetical protein
MTHVGLGPKHLDKVQAALEAADSPVTQLDLSGRSAALFELGFKGCR